MQTLLNVFNHSITYFHTGCHKTTKSSKLSQQPSQKLPTFNPRYLIPEGNLYSSPLSFPPFQKPVATRA